MKVYSKFGYSLLLVLSVCGPRALEGQATRHFLPAKFALERTIGENSADELFMPGMLRASPRGDLVLVDEQSIRAFSVEGEELWRYGRKGHGPGELAIVRDLLVDRNGDVLVMDGGNQRFIRLSATGKLVAELRFPASTEPRRLLPTIPGTSFSYIAVGGTLWTASRGGTRLQGPALPPSLIFKNALLADPYVTGHPGGSTVAYRWSSKVVFLDSVGGLRGISAGAEVMRPAEVSTRSMEVPKELPEVKSLVVTKVTPGTPQASLGVSANRDRTYVRFAGTTKDAGRIIDIYENKSGKYVGSYRLPIRPASFAVLPDGRIATLETDMLPVIKVWRVRGK